MTKKGAALIMAYMVITVLTVLSIAFLSRRVSESNITKRYGDSSRAFWLAESGIQRGIWESQYGSGWGNDVGNTQASLSGFGDYDYSLTYSGNTATINAIGYYPNRSASSPAVRNLSVQFARQAGSLFSFAVFGRQSFSLSGNAWTNSYDSSVGPYGPHNFGHSGDVGTNGTTNGAVSLSGNARVDGDASTGPNGTVTTSANSRITGQITHENSVNFDAPTVDSALTSLSSAGAYSVSGNNTRTLSGNYKFTSLSVSGNGQLTFTGTTKIYLTSNASSLSVTGNGRLNVAPGAQVSVYVDGSAVISGNGVSNYSATPRPVNFALYGTGNPTSRSVSISGNGRVYGVVYAPDASVIISGNGTIYGSVVGQTVNMSGNAGLHYDTSLASNGGGGSSATYSVQGWQETTPSSNQ